MATNVQINAESAKNSLVSAHSAKGVKIARKQLKRYLENAKLQSVIAGNDTIWQDQQKWNEVVFSFLCDYRDSEGDRVIGKNGEIYTTISTFSAFIRPTDEGKYIIALGSLNPAKIGGFNRSIRSEVSNQLIAELSSEERKALTIAAYLELPALPGSDSITEDSKPIAKTYHDETAETIVS